MEKETCIFNLQNYLDNLSKEYDCGVWICKKFGKRLSFFVGVKPYKFLPPKKIDIGENYVLFIEDFTRIEKTLEEIIFKIKNILLTK